VRLLQVHQAVSERLIQVRDAKFYIDPEQSDNVTVDEIYALNIYGITFPPREIPPPVLDIGCYKGIFSVMCAMKGCRVVAYEPNPDSFITASRNIELNNVQVELHPAGVWSKDAYLKIHKHPTSAGCNSLYHTGHTCSTDCEVPGDIIPCESFDSIIGDTNWAFVKMDCEGAEYEILLNCSNQSLKQIDQIAIELHGPDMLQEKMYQPMLRRMNEYFHLQGRMSFDKNPMKRLNYLYGEKR
jgi:FkbM family methyltransferase